MHTLYMHTLHYIAIHHITLHYSTVHHVTLKHITDYYGALKQITLQILTVHYMDACMQTHTSIDISHMPYYQYWHYFSSRIYNPRMFLPVMSTKVNGRYLPFSYWERKTNGIRTSVCWLLGPKLAQRYSLPNNSPEKGQNNPNTDIDYVNHQKTTKLYLTSPVLTGRP